MGEEVTFGLFERATTMVEMLSAVPSMRNISYREKVKESLGIQEIALLIAIAFVIVSYLLHLQIGPISRLRWTLWTAVWVLCACFFLFG